MQAEIITIGDEGVKARARRGIERLDSFLKVFRDYVEWSKRQRLIHSPTAAFGVGSGGGEATERTIQRLKQASRGWDDRIEGQIARLAQADALAVV